VQAFKFFRSGKDLRNLKFLFLKFLFVYFIYFLNMLGQNPQVKIHKKPGYYISFPVCTILRSAILLLKCLVR
jgi:hypothetical protein